MSNQMKRTRLSLVYVAGYLIFAGVLLIAAPQTSLTLLQSNGDYGDVLPRLLGIVLLALGIVIAQIIRLRVEGLYGTTIVVRLGILVGLGALYAFSLDPLFLVLLGVVGFGVVLTGTSFLLDRRRAASA